MIKNKIMGAVCRLKEHLIYRAKLGELWTQTEPNI